MDFENRETDMLIAYVCPIHHIENCLCSYPKATVVRNLQGVKMDGQIRIDGKKFDEGKPMWELLPYDALEGAVRVLTMGSKKYGNRNWENGINYSRLFGALIRHLWKWWMCKVAGETGLDDESGLSHLDHAICEILFLKAHECRKMENFDDRPMPSRT